MEDFGFKVILDEFGYSGYVESLAEANNCLELYQNITVTKFVYAHKDKNFGKTELANLVSGKIIMWKGADRKSICSKLPFDNVPYIVASKVSLVCHQSVTKTNSKKDFSNDHGYYIKMIVGTSKKVGCPATVGMREIIKFPKFSIPLETEHRKKSASARLKKALAQGQISDSEVDRRIYIDFPEPEVHFGHDIGPESGYSLPIHKELISVIHDKVKCGITTIGEMAECLEDYVNHKFKDGRPPDRDNNSWFPTDKDISNHIYIALKSV